MDVSNIIYDQDGKTPFGLIYHGFDQKVTLIARAAAVLTVGQLVRVYHTGDVLTAFNTLNYATHETNWYGVVVEVTHKASRQTGSLATKVGDFVEVQIEGYAGGVTFPSNSITSAVGHILQATTASPYFSSAAKTAGRLVNTLSWASVVTNTSATVKDLHLLGRALLSR
jgi:hypothetical protein